MPVRQRRAKPPLPSWDKSTEVFLERYVDGAPPGSWAVLPTKEGKRLGVVCSYGLDTEDHHDMVESIDNILGEDPRHDFYVTVSVQSEKPKRGKRGTTATALAVRAAYLDIDWKDATDPEAPDLLDRAITAVLALPIGRPTAIIASGAGIHVWYFYEHFEPINTERSFRVAEEAQIAVRSVAVQYLQPAGFTPDHGTDLVKLLRIPGTFNFKRPQAEKVRLVHWDPKRTYLVEELREDAQALLPTTLAPTSPAGRSTRRRRRDTTGEITPIKVKNPWRRLSPRAKSALREEPTNDRSAQTFKVVLTLLEDGWSDGEIVHLVPAHHEPTQERRAGGRNTSADVAKILRDHRPQHDHAGKTCGEAGCPNFRANVRADLEAYLVRWQREVQRLARGRNKPSQWLTAFALADIARRAGSAWVDADQRTLADASGVNRETVDTALKALVSIGVLEKMKDRQRHLAQRYGLRCPSVADDGSFDEVQVLGFGDADVVWREFLDPGDDLWAHGSGFAKSGYFAFRALAGAQGPLPTKAVNSQCPHGIDATRKALRELEIAQVARSSEEGWVLTDDALGELRRRRETVRTRGRRARRRQRHAEERAEFHGKEDDQSSDRDDE